MSYSSGPSDQRPLPVPTELSAPHWDGAKAGRLMVQKCASCAQYVFIPRHACPNCLSGDLEWMESSGKGVIYSFTIIHRPPHPSFEPPYCAAIIELDEGWHMLSNVIADDLGAIAVGQRVRVDFIDADGMTLPIFRPDDS